MTLEEFVGRIGRGDFYDDFHFLRRNLTRKIGARCYGNGGERATPSKQIESRAVEQLPPD